jgi:hypothetical protein
MPTVFMLPSLFLFVVEPQQEAERRKIVEESLSLLQPVAYQL